MKQLFIIKYENAFWCGGELNVCVWALNPDDAVNEASDHMEESQRDLFQTEIDEDIAEGGNADEDTQSTVTSVEFFNKDHNEWEFYQNPTQSEFYPVIGQP